MFYFEIENLRRFSRLSHLKSLAPAKSIGAAGQQH